jgi:hypothetical protein
MRLTVYCDSLYDQAHSRRGMHVEQFRIQLAKANSEGLILGCIRFWDDSLLYFREELVERNVTTVRVNYAYHYQSAGGALLFRYDRSSHYPELVTFPHHKHIVVDGEETVEAAQPPTLSEVLREIEGLLYSQST